MSKIKTTLKEPTIDNRLLDDRGPTWELLQKIDVIQSDTGTISIRVQQSPIERAVARGTISEQHGRAAAKFYHHWRRSGCSSIPSNWKSEVAPGGGTEHIPMAKTELEAFDRRQIRRAIDAIHENMDRCGMSNDAIKLLFSVVCDEFPFEAAGKLIWPRMGENAAGARAITYVRGALRVLSIEWGV